MRLSIRKKTIAMILSFAIVLILVSVVIYSRVISNITEEYYNNKADESAAAIAASIDVERFERLSNEVKRVFNATENKVRSDDWGTPEFNAYVANYDYITETEDFIVLHDFLAKMEQATDVKCAYCEFVDIPTESCVYIVDADPVEPCPPGCIDPLYDMNRELLTRPERGFPAYITDTEEYGWLVSGGVAIKNASGVVIGYALVDISMDEVRSEQITQIAWLVMWLLLAVALICVVGILIVNRSIVKPLGLLTETAAGYSKKNESGVYDGFSKLKIETGDELEYLSESMKRMEHDLNDYINDVFVARGEARRSQSIAEEMTEIANTDALTGVRNKTAYDSEAQELDKAIDKGDARFGIVMIDLNGLKKTNDTYGHEHGDELIKALGTIICETFDHSPVFRIGGDEFVVIVMKAQYDFADDLIKEFNAKIDALSSDKSLKPWQRVSAAIGFARFDPETDKKTSAVFRRADEAMYERKREMKKQK